jgi:hypothetical protein
MPGGANPLNCDLARTLAKPPHRASAEVSTNSATTCKPVHAVAELFPPTSSPSFSDPWDCRAPHSGSCLITVSAASIDLNGAIADSSRIVGVADRPAHRVRLQSCVARRL